MSQTFIALIPGIAAPPTIYLNGSGTPWDGTGTPWDTVSTSPIELAMNETSGTKWTPQGAQALIQYEGGPPFSNGQRPRVAAYGNVTETFTLQLRASGTDTQRYDRCVYLKNLLHQAFNTALYGQPAILQLIPFNTNGAQHTTTFEIYRAELQEDPRFLNDEAGAGLMRVVVTITRAPLANSGLETVLNAQTFTNNGASNVNYALAVTGELALEGQPMNVALSGGTLATSGIKNIWLAVVKTTRNTTRADAISTSSSTGVAVGSSVNYSIDADAALCTRIVARVASPSANLQLRAVVTWPGSATILTTDWLSGGSTSGAFYDLGYLDLAPAVRRAAGTGAVAITVTIQARSTSGAVTGTLSWIGCIDYYTWCRAISPSVAASTTFSTTGATTNAAIDPPFVSAGATYANNMSVYGTPPIAYKDSSLFVIWDAAGAHTNADTITVSAECLPQYRTFAGDGEL